MCEVGPPSLVTRPSTLLEVEHGRVGRGEVAGDEHERMVRVRHAGGADSPEVGDDPLRHVVEVGGALPQVAAHGDELVAERGERLEHGPFGGLARGEALRRWRRRASGPRPSWPGPRARRVRRRLRPGHACSSSRATTASEARARADSSACERVLGVSVGSRKRFGHPRDDADGDALADPGARDDRGGEAITRHGRSPAVRRGRRARSRRCPRRR